MVETLARRGVGMTFTPAQEAFREEVEAFCRQEAVQRALADLEAQGEVHGAHSPVIHRLLAEKRWLGLHWPEKYGGLGKTHTEVAIFGEVLGYHRVPMLAYILTVRVAASAIIACGTPAQKEEFLPKIARGEILFCQGYTEPSSGSDLASLQTKATEDGDSYVINGQKIFTSHAHVADWCLLLARSDPNASKHHGLSHFLVDMKTPGITVSPLWTMGGGRVNAVYFDNVRVPKELVVGGEPNQGWKQAGISLSFERSGSHNVGLARRIVDDLVRYVREQERDGKPLGQDAFVRQELARAATDTTIARLLSFRVAHLQEQGKVPDREASVAKVFTTELVQRLTRVGMQILGPHAQLRLGSPYAPLNGTIEALYRQTRSLTIVSGTTEIQRNIIALRGLGLPR